MIRVGQCPVCGQNYLQILKKYNFILPETKEYDSLTEDVTYNYERLRIFFEKIWKDTKPAVFDVTFCKACGMIFSNPRFTKEEIITKYRVVSQSESAKKRIQKCPALKTNERAMRIYSLITELQGSGPKPQRILDYAGAQGYNLLPFIKNGNFGHLIDYVKYDYPEGIKYIGRDLGDLENGEVFDAILLCHTLEHAIEPRCMISELSSHLTEEGLIYVEVPLGCWKEWKILAEPLTHINFFSEESVFKCLRGAGLNIIYLSTAYQWVTHGKMWCINIVGSKCKRNTVMKFKTAQQQMGNLYYYLKPLMNNPRYYLMRLTKKC